MHLKCVEKFPVFRQPVFALLLLVSLRAPLRDQCGIYVQRDRQKRGSYRSLSWCRSAAKEYFLKNKSDECEEVWNRPIWFNLLRNSCTLYTLSYTLRLYPSRYFRLTN